MNEIIINDNLERNNRMLNRLTTLIDTLFLQIQEAESEKTPAKLRPYTINLSAPQTPNPQVVQIMPRNAARDSLSIYNVGPGSLIWSNTWFDPTSMLQQFSDPAHPNTITPLANQLIEIGYLPSGGSVSINSTEAIMAYNVGGVALLTITESSYLKSGNFKGYTFPPPGVDGALGAGYDTVSDVDSNPILVKGIR